MAQRELSSSTRVQNLAVLNAATAVHYFYGPGARSTAGLGSAAGDGDGAALRCGAADLRAADALAARPLG
jgi:hypothetical protein